MSLGIRKQRVAMLAYCIERQVLRSAEGEERAYSHGEGREHAQPQPAVDLGLFGSWPTRGAHRVASRAGHRCSIFGSNASRRPSPRRLKARTVKKMARLGNSA